MLQQQILSFVLQGFLLGGRGGLRGSWPCSSGLKLFRLTIVSTAVISKALSFSRQLPVVRSHLTRVTDCPIRSVFSVITENQSEPGPSQGFSELFSPFVIRKREGLWDHEWWANNLSAKPHDFLSCMRNVRHTHGEDASSLPVLHILHAPSNVSSI